MQKNTKASPPIDHLADLEGEQSVLGAILLRPDTLYDVAAVLPPEAFYGDGHRLIYQAMLDLAMSGQAVDLVTVTSRLRDLELLQQTGGPVFLAQLSEHVGTASNAVHYAGRVSNKALIRRLRDTAREIVQASERPHLSAREFLDWAEAQIFERCHQAVQSAPAQLLETLVDQETEILAEIHATQKPAGLATGYPDLDRFLSWCPGDLVILAGRTSMGKTSLALNLALRAATAGVPAGLFSLEMSQSQLIRRLLAIQGKIDASRLNRVRLQAEEWQALYRAAAGMCDLPFWIDDSPSLSVLELRSRARRARGKGQLDLLVVDYLQLVRPLRRGRSREEEVAETCRGLKTLAGELKIPILALAQLSRKVEDRPQKRPQLADLRESGAIEQDADLVLFIYRDEVYHPGSEDQGKAEVIVGKNRNGRTGTVKLAYQDKYLRFDNLAEAG